MSNKIYENKLIILFFCTWGFLFIDRLSITFILPVITQDLQINNAQVGILNLAFTVAWGASAIVVSSIADKKGNLKRWLLLSGFLTSIFGAACALATSFETLIVFRILVGIAEGPFSTFIMAMLGKSVCENRLGLSVGIVNTGVAVIAAAMAPILLTQLVAVTTWQMVFFVGALPGLIFMIVVTVFVKPVPDTKREDVTKDDGSPLEKRNMFAELWSYRNFRICFFLAMVHMAGYYIMQIFATLYWVNVAGLTVQTAGALMSGAGLVGIFTCIFLPKLSDIYGRRPVMMAGYLLSVLPSLFMFLLPGSTASMVIFVLCASIPGALGIFWINLIPIETLPKYLTATGISVPMAMGEFIGGAVITAIAGVIADMYGLPTMMIIAACGMVASFLLAIFVIETSPRALERKAARLSAEPK